MDERIWISGQYPRVNFIKEEANNKLVLCDVPDWDFWDDREQPARQFSAAGLQEQAFNILQIPFEDTKPETQPCLQKRKIKKKKYVCISAQSNSLLQNVE